VIPLVSLRLVPLVGFTLLFIRWLRVPTDPRISTPHAYLYRHLTEAGTVTLATLLGAMLWLLLPVLVGR
jgi:hypothetical protein